MAEQKCELRLPGSHALVPWSYIHAAWFHNHSTIKTSPFQLAFGRSYAGRVACFGETVMVLHRRGVNCKAGPQWVPGIWLGKSEQEDLHVVATPEGILRGKAIRRTAEPWRGVWLFMVNQKPYQPSGRKSNLRSLRLGAPATPKPVSDVQDGKAEENIDYDAKDVIEYAKKHPDDSDHDVDDVEIGETADLKHEKTEGSFLPRKSARLDDESAGQVPTSHKRSASASGSNNPSLVEDIPVFESQFKSPRLSPEGSPTSGPLYSPHFAGSINNVQLGATDDDHWEQDIMDYMDQDELPADGFDDELIDEGKPPELPADELEKLDIEAGFTEIDRLLKMGVLKEPTDEDLSQGTILTTSMVFDWRFRENGWLRGGRYVAREFRGNDRGNSETFAPTSGIGSRLVLLLHICLRWFMSFMDVKDAFLLVPQQERVLLKSLCGMLEKDPKEPVRFLKKRHFFTGAGVVISPHEKYIEELVKAHRSENRKPKATPDIALECLDGDELEDEEKHIFRSSMGILHAGALPFPTWWQATASWRRFMARAQDVSVVSALRCSLTVVGQVTSLYIGRLWEFLVRKDVSIAVVTDSSSGKAFAQRLGVGRMKHIDVKFLWLQRCVKEQLLTMESVGTLFNVADLGTKKLNKARRLFLMFLMNIVEFKDEIDCYVPVGEDEYNDYMQKKMIGQSMKTVRQVMAQTRAGGMENFKPKISTSMVRAMILLAMQPMAKGLRVDELNLDALLVTGYLEVFMENTYFLFVYGMVFFIVGFALGYNFKKLFIRRQLKRTWFWIKDKVLRHWLRWRVIQYVDDWDPINCELRQFRVLSSAEDAWSGEEHIRETPQGLAKYVPRSKETLQVRHARSGPLGGLPDDKR
eukprot:s218_g11.t1